MSELRNTLEEIIKVVDREMSWQPALAILQTFAASVLTDSEFAANVMNEKLPQE